MEHDEGLCAASGLGNDGSCGGPPSIDMQWLEKFSATYHQCALSEGVQQARKTMFAPALVQWHKGLLDSSRCLSRNDMAVLGSAMSITLAVRDALILSVVARDGECGESSIIEYAVHPHDPNNVRHLYQVLDAAFNDRNVEPEMARCHRAVRMLKGMLRSLPRQYTTQPSAVLAYALWWMNDGSALSYARMALENDHECTLARIVGVALERDLHPAWSS
ncbi:DUF4192 family protein [Bifidobacterium bombi]|uniref:DUF4192 family protein n=1 Tax=Bifidobacterium bombi DSM 19703 TaxID=1341695 RepID=A0A080N4B4_9BIFI|nr:DUF4192 family protein [Bifidobacterium bombi]KFF31205.1 hypothetical protein BBOMB_0542 [Bifidobacterium bombi DSM 19703]